MSSSQIYALSISERDDDDEMMRDKRVKRKMSFFLRFVDETTAVFGLVSWTAGQKMDQNGPKMMTTERRERGFVG